MYHEEQWIDGKLYWREAPDAEWKPYSYEEMYQKYVQANKWANGLYERLTHLRSTESPADSPASPVQQLGAEITALVTECNIEYSKYPDVNVTLKFIERIQQLLAVYRTLV
jgi:hypothetical protein